MHTSPFSATAVRLAAVLGPILLLTALPGCGSGNGNGNDETHAFEGGGRVREATRVRVSPVGQRDMVRVTSTTTAIRSEREVEVFPRIAGTVTELKVEEGDRVELGQTLCVLDDRQAQSALADANVALKEAQDGVPRAELTVRERTAAVARALLAFEQAVRDVDRNEKAGLVSKNDLDKMKLARDQAEQDHATALLGVESAEADRDAASTAIDRALVAVDKATLELSYTNVVAPYAGVISARSVEIGDSVSSGKVLFNMVDPDLVRAVIYRPQRELSLYRNAVANRASSPIRIEAQPDAIPGATFQGTIRIVSPTIDSTSGSVKLTIDLDQPSEASGEPRLLPGMLVRLNIVTDKHEGALVVPKRALRREGDRRFLFIVRDGTIARRVEVEEGFADDLEVEVTPSIDGELHVGDLVIVVGNRDLEDGEEVEVQEEAPVDDEVSEANADAVAVAMTYRLDFRITGPSTTQDELVTTLENQLTDLTGALPGVKTGGPEDSLLIEPAELSDGERTGTASGICTIHFERAHPAAALHMNAVAAVAMMNLPEGIQIHVVGPIAANTIEPDSAKTIEQPTRDQLLLRVALEGASAEDVERMLAGPLLEAMAMASGVSSLSSTSAQGWVDIKVTLNPGEDPASVMAAVRKSIADVTLPPKASVPTIRKIDAGDQEEG